MKRTLTIALVILASACSQDTNVGTPPASSGSLPISQPPASSTPAPNPDAKYTHSCDLLLNSNYQSSVTGWLVGDASIHNTGNIGVVVRISATWQRAGEGPLRASKKLRLPYASRRAAHFKLPVDQNTVSSVQSSTGYQNATQWCGVKATLLSTFGAAH